MRQLFNISALIAAMFAASIAAASELPGDNAHIRLVRHGQTESVAIEGGNYRDFKIEDRQASFILDARLGVSGERIYEDGNIKRLSWEALPFEAADSRSDYSPAKVTLEFSRKPANSLINAVSGTESDPGLPQVVAGFSFSGNKARGHRPLAGGRGADNDDASAYGEYELPKMPYPHYSDALVTLKVQNTDFREVLWLLSEIGEVSIMLDPYWDDEPTGSRRPVGGGASGDSSGGGNAPGFRNGSNFGGPQAPREGTGNLSLDFKNVPFDMALDLVLQSVGLVKVDIYPSS